MNRMEELELQYSPSRWSKRYSAEEAIPKHIEFAAKVSDEARKNVPCQLNVSYGPLEREKMDIYGTNLPPGSPIFIYIHGGYWQELRRELSAYAVESLHKHNFKVIVLGYTLCPQISLDKLVEEIKSAFLLCIKYAKISGSRAIYLGGHSCGAHLVASLFESFFSSLPSIDQQLLKGVFLISGVYDLIPLVETYVNDAVKLDRNTAKKLSPMHQHFELSQVCDTIPFFIIVGENDSPAFIEQSKSFHKKLNELECNTSLIVLNEVDHFNIVELLSDDNYKIIKLIVSTNEETCKLEN